MPRLCTICTNVRRRDIDMALIHHRKSYRGIAAEYGLTEASLERHEQNHLKSSFELSRGITAMLNADNLLERLASLDEQTLEMLTEARNGGDLRTALAAVRESRGNIEAYSRIGNQSDLSELAQEIQSMRAAAETRAQAIYDRDHPETSTSLQQLSGGCGWQ